ncbi:uncharacterized protein LOC113152661 [Anabas testudineus]|uniref:uncharacterized protein LOC113152661 n=1 Tax=Anabas testudineus TaxID=64144 RepID=UPI000E45EA6D|nr:uncharacterized protein LOC113152661 [Anabas testudineus]
MKSGERKVALLTITEHIEMELLSSEEPCVVILTQEEEKEHSFHQRYLEHPLVPDCEEEPAPEVQTQHRGQPKPKTEPPARQASGHYTPVLRFVEQTEIEMEVFPPIKVSGGELLNCRSDGPSVMTPLTPNKVSRLKWKRLSPQKTGLVVKDVICLPRGHYMAHLDRHVVPQGKEREALTAMGMTARITIDYGWSSNHMATRLVMLFQGRFVKRVGQRFSFTYLQCVQGSRVLFAPDPPAEGWTGEQVLRISGHGPLYIFSHQDCPQAGSGSPGRGTPAVNRKEFCLKASTESCQDGDGGPGKTEPDSCMQDHRGVHT